MAEIKYKWQLTPGPIKACPVVFVRFHFARACEQCGSTTNKMEHDRKRCNKCTYENRVVREVLAIKARRNKAAANVTL